MMPETEAHSPPDPSTSSSEPTVSPKRPGLLGYALAAGLLLIGAGAFLSALLPASREVRDAIENLQRVVLPAQTELTFAESGVVTLYHERASVIDNKPIGDGTTYAGPILHLRCVADGSRIEPEPTNPTTGSETTRVVYRLDTFAGDSLASYTIPEAGVYTIVPAVEAALPETPTVIAAGHVPVELSRSGYSGVYGGAVTLGLCFSAAVMVALVTWARRNPPHGRGLAARGPGGSADSRPVVPAG